MRVQGPEDTLSPFTEGAIDFVYELDHGRPGFCLLRLFYLLEAAATEGTHTIERQFAEQFFAAPRQSESVA